METQAPRSPEELAEALRAAAEAGRTIQLEGAGTKRGMAGPIAEADVCISTVCTNRLLKYEPRDLTISVEAGMRWAELERLLASNRQMVPLDPPFHGAATVGGVIAANSSGPRRRLYGTARDLVIGMKFATLGGKLVQSGGMVVKNVAGLDMGKMMIGSFGTLAAIAVVNFKLIPMPARTRTFLMHFDSLDSAMGIRDQILRSVLQPSALDLLNRDGGWLLAVRAGGNEAVMDRYARELGESEVVEGEGETLFWEEVREYTPRFLETAPDGAVVRVSTTLAGLKTILASSDGPVIARAASGVCYCYFQEAEAAARWMARDWKTVVEFAPAGRKRELELWPRPGNDFEVMQNIKRMFDPGGLLNRGRLYGRL
jgi:glycolate oxidase FAD binding subunit